MNQLALIHALIHTTQTPNVITLSFLNFTMFEYVETISIVNY